MEALTDRSAAARKGWITRRRNIAWRASPMGQMMMRQARYHANQLVEQIKRSTPVLKKLMAGSKR